MRIDSRIDYSTLGYNFSYRVKGKAKVIPAEGFGGTHPRPSGSLDYASVSGAIALDCISGSVTSTKSGRFEISNVLLTPFDPNNPSNAPVVGLKIHIPVDPVENYTVTGCDGETDVFTHPFWSAGFMAEHPDGVAGLCCLFTGLDFHRSDAPVFAIAVYGPRPVSADDSVGGTFRENTLVEIVHTPQQPVPIP